MKLYKFAKIYYKQAGVVIPFPHKKDTDPDKEKLKFALDEYFDEFVRPVIGKAFHEVDSGIFPIDVIFRDDSNFNKKDQIKELIFKQVFEKEIGWMNPSDKLIAFLNEKGITEEIYGRYIDFAILDLYEKEFTEMVEPV